MVAIILLKSLIMPENNFNGLFLENGGFMIKTFSF
jgi:hypothetical protein